MVQLDQMDPQAQVDTRLPIKNVCNITTLLIRDESCRLYRLLVLRPRGSSMIIKEL